MRTSPRFEAVIFDLDGVLVDTEIWWDEVRADFATRHGRSWAESDRRAVMGANSRQWSATIARRLNLELSPQQIEREIVDAMVIRYREREVPASPGAVEVVRRLNRQFDLAVASSAHRAVIAAALDRLGLTDAFSAVVSSDEVERGKPAPDVFLEAARRLGQGPARCLVVEDSLNGVLAARAAGMCVALVPNESIPPAPGAREAADFVLGSLAELPEVALGRAI